MSPSEFESWLETVTGWPVYRIIAPEKAAPPFVVWKLEAVVPTYADDSEHHMAYSAVVDLFARDHVPSMDAVYGLDGMQPVWQSEDWIDDMVQLYTSEYRISWHGVAD